MQGAIPRSCYLCDDYSRCDTAPKLALLYLIMAQCCMRAQLSIERYCDRMICKAGRGAIQLRCWMLMHRRAPPSVCWAWCKVACYNIQLDAAPTLCVRVIHSIYRSCFGQAKNYRWEGVFDALAGRPELINVQPLKRWTALHQAAEAATASWNRLFIDSLY